ncbi:MAG: TIGR02584 family CRISPR-associated protein [Oligosphaeraceae bacterium]|nr:TIGR02584 family CRISPR-associated protein [Oligosphaeraceae bacterium]
MHTEHSQNILVALCGISPAVITEAAWALWQGKNPHIIHEVIVITTSAGRKCLQDHLLDSGIWEQLRADLGAGRQELLFGDTAYNIRELPSADRSHDLADICTEEDNLAMADTFLDILRGLCDNPVNRIFVSIAGGRKTMSAMMALCFSLTARPQDQLCHVLVNPPFDSPQLQPLFFYPPNTPSRHFYHSTVLSSAAAEINLITIPVARLRQLYTGSHGQLPGNYRNLVSLADDNLQAAHLPVLQLDHKQGSCRFDDQELALAPKEFMLYYTIACCSKKNQLIEGTVELGDKMQSVHQRIRLLSHHRLQKNMLNDEDAIRKSVSDIRRKIKSLLPPAYRHLYYPSGSFGPGRYRLALPMDKIIIL